MFPTYFSAAEESIVGFDITVKSAFDPMRCKAITVKIELNVDVSSFQSCVKPTHLYTIDVKVSRRADSTSIAEKVLLNDDFQYEESQSSGLKHQFDLMTKLQGLYGDETADVFRLEGFSIGKTKAGKMPVMIRQAFLVSTRRF